MLQSYPFATFAASLESPKKNLRWSVKIFSASSNDSDEGYGLIKGQAGGYHGVHRS